MKAMTIHFLKANWIGLGCLVLLWSLLMFGQEHTASDTFARPATTINAMGADPCDTVAREHQ